MLFTVDISSRYGASKMCESPSASAGEVDAVPVDPNLL